MAGVNTTIKISDNLFDKIDNLEEKLKDLSVPLNEFGEHLDLVTRERFDREESPDGVKWKPLSRDYAEYKKKKYGAQKPILVLNETLRDSIVPQLKGKTALLFGTVIEYGATHQFGRGNIPARKFLGANEDDKEILKEIIENYLIFGSNKRK